ncbi:MAG: phosphopyruvate hydratase [Candidatus Moranbacteria bacterium RIFCSPHIGHO2_02_FULL_40_12b]|nr:MAG: phosphopyruvate hydratase [Candidatus Moranbacteria bacterium RIFCSPHIGHO2_02_FULL_40_12b]
MSKIKSIKGREILDSRGNPTVEVEVELENGIRAIAAVPSGASTGTFEALELRDNDPNRYGGQGVLNAVKNINKKIQEAIKGMEAGNQEKIDKKMIKSDGTENKSNLGANAILGVSLAVCRAAALDNNLPLYAYIKKIYQIPNTKYQIPIPMFNVINGGKHSDSGLSIQEFMIIPIGIEKFSEQLRAGSEIFHALKKLLEKDGYSSGVGDEGGFAPQLESNPKALEYIIEAIKAAGYKSGVEVCIGLDAAANSFYNHNENQYALKPENAMLTKESLINLYREWIDKYSIISIEDGLHEDDWEGWPLMMQKIAKKPMMARFDNSVLENNLIIGDDLLVTNVKRLEKAIEKGACNAILVKVNQIGTLSETIECVKLAKKNKMETIISNRSGETTDDFIADLAVGAGADFIKSGSLSRGERICKYNRLLRIEKQII